MNSFQGVGVSYEKGLEPTDNCPIESLEPFDSRKVNHELKIRRKAEDLPDNAFENKAWLVIHSLCPKLISIGKDPKITFPGGFFTPDTIAVFPKYILLVESKNTEASVFISEWISQFREARKSHMLQHLIKSYPGTDAAIAILIVKNSSSIIGRNSNELKQLGIKLFDERDLDYFLTIKRAVGIGVGHLFWARVAPRIFDDSEEKQLPALCVSLGRKKEAYIFAAKPRQLLIRCFVSHREINSKPQGVQGYQRMLQPKKLIKIARYIENGNTFPTPIVVAFKPKRKYFQPTTKDLQKRQDTDGRKTVIFGHVELPSEPGSIQIIDGQHRLFGYTKVEPSEKHIIQVIAYSQPGDQNPANLFVDINSEQTPVKSNLLWELYPDIYSPEDDLYYLATISNAVEESVFSLIPEKVQHISRGTKGKITFQTLCSEIKKARLVGKNGTLTLDPNATHQEIEHRLKNVLNAAFGAMIALGHKREAVNSEFLFTNNGIIPIIRILNRRIRQIFVENPGNLSKRQDLQEDIQNYLSPIYEYYGAKSIEDLGKARKAATGNAGQNTADDIMTDCIRRIKSDFPHRSGYIDKNYKDIVEPIANKTEEINSKAVILGRSVEWVFKEFSYRDFLRSLRRPIQNERDYNHLLDVLYKTYFEGSGKDNPENRVKKMLNLQGIKDLSIIKDIDYLRTLIEHKESQIDPKKRIIALQLMRDLSGLPTLTDKNDLQSEDYLKISKKLLSRVNSELLDPLLECLKTNPVY
jgi:DGQHR domain-containing protein